MLTPLKTEVSQIDDLSHEARRFRTIARSFERNLELLFKGTGVVTTVDRVALAQAFARWRQAFDNNKYLAEINKHDFIIYSAGVMLKELIAAAPLKTMTERGEGIASLALPDGHRLKSWPEGYAYTSFCLSVAAAILEEIGDTEPAGGGPANDPKFWETFRENAGENPALAIAFFDVVCGVEPNWNAPDVPWMRKSLMANLKISGGDQ